MRALLATFALATAFAADISAPALAQGEARPWPQRNVRLVLPFGAGSSTDVMARLLAERLQAKWGHPIVIENRPGGDGLLSITTFVQAKDDHTFFFSPTSVFVVHPYVHANLAYDANRDLVPIVRLSRTLLVLAAPAALPAKDMKEFVALVRASPGNMNYGMTPGFTEFVFEGFLREQGLKMAKVPYRDIVQAPTDLGENRLQILGVSHTVALPQIQAGRVKLLAVADSKRSDLAPETPSVHEAGFPSLESVSMVGAWGPPGMPLELRKRIAADFIAQISDPDIARRLRAAAQMLDPAGPEEFAVSLKRLDDQVAGIAKLVGVARKK
jgi:tripartite-type tricarboxylate transporter receptor subunit TctC